MVIFLAYIQSASHIAPRLQSKHSIFYAGSKRKRKKGAKNGLNKKEQGKCSSVGNDMKTEKWERQALWNIKEVDKEWGTIADENTGGINRRRINHVGGPARTSRLKKCLKDKRGTNGER